VCFACRVIDLRIWRSITLSLGSEILEKLFIDYFLKNFMVDLNMRVFERFIFAEIIGETPQPSPEIRKQLQSELSSAIKGLETKNHSELQEILEHQKAIKRQLNKLTGAMALSQEKINLFLESITKYIEEVESRLKITR
jgi:phosphoglycerate-specific signal transduction histidine kinase